jgi:hypothetical protein
MNTDHAQDLVEIDRFECNYILETAQCDPVDLQMKLDGIAKNLLPATWDSMAGTTVVDPAIYFIKELEVDLDIDLKMNEQETAGIWCGAIKGAITDRILHGRDVIRFSGRREYISGLVSDLLADRAWDRWYYYDLHDLQNHTKRSAIMTVLRDNCDIIEPVLLSVSEESGKFDDLSKVLTDADLREIYETLLPYEESGIVRISEVVRAVLDALTLRWYTEPDYRTVLSVYLSMLRRMHAGASEKMSSEHTFLRSGLLRESIIHILKFHQLMHSPAYHDIYASLLAGNLDQAAELAQGTPYTGSVSFWSGVVDLEGNAVINTMIEAVAVKADKSKVIYSRSGVLFLLAEHIRRLDPVVLAGGAGLPSLSGYGGLHWLIASLAVKLTGHSPDENVHDDGIGIFAGMNENSAIHTSGYAGLVPADSASAFKAALLGMFHRNNLLKGDYLWVQKGPEKGMILVQDIETGLICWGEYYNSEKDEKAIDRVNRFIEVYETATTQSPGVLIFGKEFVADIDTAELDKRKVSFIVMETDFLYTYPEEGYTNYRIQESDAAGNVREIVIEGNGAYIKYRTNLKTPVSRYLGILKKKQPADRHIEFFKSTSAIGFDIDSAIDFDLAVSLASGAVMKMFVSELRGFEHSSPWYILENFLSGDSVIEVDENSIRVSINGIPLTLVLTMAGVCTGRFRVPWIYDRDIEVTLK